MMWNFSGAQPRSYSPAYTPPPSMPMPTPTHTEPPDDRGMPSPSGFLTVPGFHFPGLPHCSQSDTRVNHHERHQRRHSHSYSPPHVHHHRTHSNPPPPRPPVMVLTSSHHPQVVHHSHSHTDLRPRPVAAAHHSAVPTRPYNPVYQHPVFQYSKCTGKRKALCIGINYRGQPNELRGCINDARNVRAFLIKNYHFRASDIILLTDDSSNPRSLPTRKNILDAMRWLVADAHTHDSLFFHYSGHGGQTKDLDGDEVDGMDEVIYPLDFRKRGHIVDDEMHRIMVSRLPVGCRLTALFDCCHSGSALDLPYIYSSSGRLKGQHVKQRALARKSTGADVISLAGCKDGQTSADTFHGGVAVGAMSFAFMTSLTQNPHQSYQALLKSVRGILFTKFSQKPQLSSSHPIDTNLGFII